jgi:hypothetical protein
MDIETVKLILPVITFALGAVFTLWLKAFESSRDSRRTSVREVCRAAKDWYIQIHKVVLSSNGVPIDKGSDPALHDYLRNRIILPDLLLHSGILRGKRSCRRLVMRVDEFLGQVTNFEQRKLGIGGVPEGAACAEIFATEDPLEKLDDILQSIVAESVLLLR